MPSLPECRSFLSEERKRELDAADDEVYAIDARRVIVYVNHAYVAFCEQNGGELGACGLGVSLIGAITAPFLKRFYGEAYDRVFRSGERWRSRYLCHSPEETRTFDMSVEPVAVDGIVRGAIVLHHLRERGEAPLGPVEPREYRNASGFVRLCSVCRRVQPPNDPSWIWVPSLLASPAGTVSHGICESCEATYYDELP